MDPPPDAPRGIDARIDTGTQQGPAPRTGGVRIVLLGGHADDEQRWLARADDLARRLARLRTERSPASGRPDMATHGAARPSSPSPAGAPQVLVGTGRCRVGDGHAWWDGAGPDTGAADARAHLDTQLAARRPCVLVGFSQGGALALASQDLDGVVGVCAVAAFLPDDVAAVFPAGLPLLLVHGEADEVVDPAYADMVERRARRAGQSVERVDHPGGHVWDDVVADAVAEWIVRVAVQLDGPVDDPAVPCSPHGS